MADDFQTGVCSGSWWNPAKRGNFDTSSATAAVSSVSCSTAIEELGPFGWSSAAHEIIESKVRPSCEESPVASVSGRSMVTFQDAQTGGGTTSLPMVTTGFLMDSYGLSSPAVDWNQSFLSGSGRDHESNNFHGMIHEDNMSSTKPYLMEPNNQVHQVMMENSTANLFKNMNQAFLINHHQHLNTAVSEASTAAMNAFPPVILHGLFDQGTGAQEPQPNTYDTCYSQQSWSKYHPFSRPSHTMKQQLPLAATGQLHLANNGPYWNAPATAAAAHDARGGFYPSGMQTQYFSRAIDGKSSISSNSTITTKSNSEGASSTATKKNANEHPLYKKPRTETPSPLPTFKKQLQVRKEKLGDRITALQQLVSPFGKTDTASVLYEAIEYIKFLHDQVNVLSTPYLKNGHPMQHQQTSDKSKDGEGPKKDLRSRGLCLVPISSTFPVTNEPMAEFWIPNYGGSNR